MSKKNWSNINKEELNKMMRVSSRMRYAQFLNDIISKIARSPNDCKELSSILKSDMRQVEKLVFNMLPEIEIVLRKHIGKFKIDHGIS